MNLRFIAIPALVVACSVFDAIPSVGQTVDLITDRPDFTESPDVVPLGQLQIESGATWERSSGQAVVVGPEALLRWAPTGRIELRLGIPNYVDAPSVSGLSDASVGAKMELGVSRGWKIASIVSVTLPTGEEGLSSDAVDPTVLFTAGRDLSDVWSVGIQASGALMRDAELMMLGSTLVFGRGISERVGAFAELAIDAPEAGDPALVLHHGYTISIGRLLQLDVHGGLGLTTAAPDVFVGVGWSGRF